MKNINYNCLSSISLIELSPKEVTSINGGEKTAGDVVEDIGYSVGKMVGAAFGYTKRIMEGMFGM